MLETARATVGFHCPACGAGLRAACAAGGTAIDCRRCGELIRVPRRPHPVESDAADGPVVPPAAAAAAGSGGRLLLFSLAAFVAEYAVILVAVGYWVAVAGPSAVLARDAGDLRPVLVAAWALDLTLLAVRSGLRWTGYRRCEAAAAAVRADGWVAAARTAVAVRAVGYAVACGPWLAGHPADGTPIVARAVAGIGQVAWVAGTLMEFGILVAWSRLLVALDGPAAARRVSRYAMTAAFGGLAAAGGVCLVGIVMVTTLRRAGPPPASGPPGRLNFAALPAGGWYAVAAAAVLVAAFGLVLCWQYARVLAAVRAGLGPPKSDGSEG